MASGAVSVSAAAGTSAYPALVDGKVGFLVAPGGRLLRAIRFTIDGRRIREIEVISDLERLQTLELTVL